MRWLVLGLCLAACPIALGAPSPSPSPDRLLPIRYANDSLRRTDAPGCFIVTLRDGTPAGEREALFLEANGTHGATWGDVLNGFTHCNTPPHHLAWLAGHPSVTSIEEDVTVHVAQQHLEALSQSGQWGLDRIDQRTNVVNNEYCYAYTGAGITAYIVDTGILSAHQEFTGRIATGYCVPSLGSSTEDCNGHGTHVAGILGGTTVGVAKGVTLVPVRALDCAGEGALSDIVDALNWVVAQTARPAIINLSIGGTVSGTLDAAVRGAVAAGVFVVVAAGNEAVDACTDSPGDVSTAMSVGSTDPSDAMSSFSNYGACVKLFAPGSSIYSAWYTSPTAYMVLSGTSMASPCVAGVYALYLQTFPNLALSPADMLAYVQSVATVGAITSLGAGSPNLLLYSLGNSTPTLQSPQPASSGGGGGGGGNTWRYGLFGFAGFIFVAVALLLVWRMALMRRRRQRQRDAQLQVHNFQNPQRPWAPSWAPLPPHFGGMTPAPTPTPWGTV